MSTDEEKGTLPKREQQATCSFFGMPLERITFLKLPPDEGGSPRLDEANHVCIRDYLAARKLKLMFMPHGNDSNVTHQRTYALFHAVALAEQWTM